MKERVHLSPPHMSDDVSSFVSDAIDSNWIAPMGPHVDAFERELAKVLGVDHVLTTNSGTSAIHLGLLALGVSPGDEVICSSFTFCASANPIVYCGALPVFVDSERETWNMDPQKLEEAIVDRIAKTGKKPKAIVVVHLFGMPPQLSRILDVSRKYDIPVLEDSAEAMGSSYDGAHAGRLGAVGVLSFNGNKIITCSAGGAIFSSDASLIERARYLRQEAREPLPYYEHKAIGCNYRMSNILAAIGRSQLTVLDDRVRRRREIFEFYADALKEIDAINFQGEPSGMQSNRWLTAMVVRHPRVNAEKIRLTLEKENIESRPLWKPMHLQPVFRSYPYYGSGVSDDLFHHGLCLPSGTNMNRETLERVTHIIKEAFA